MAEDERETSWLEHLPSLPGVIAVLGIVAYAALRYAYTRFYSPFGVLPDEVGIGYAQVLSYAAPTLLLLVLGCGFVAATILIVNAVLRRQDRAAWARANRVRELKESLDQHPSLADEEAELQRQLQGGEEGEARYREQLLAALIEEDLAAEAAKTNRLRRNLWISILVYAVLGLALGSYFLGNAASERAHDALEGRRVVPIRVFGMELLYLRAEPAIVRPTDSAAAGSLAGYEDMCVLYLGAANGTAVFVTGDQLVLRVPDSAVVFETSLTGSSCREATA